MLDIPKILTENKLRNSIMDAPYNPMDGIGSPIERKLLAIMPDNLQWHLPVEMFSEKEISIYEGYDSVYDYCKINNPDDYDVVFGNVFMRIEAFRRRYDFEYWCFVYHPIQDAETGEVLPFTLRGAQRLVWKVVHEMILKNKPIRVIIGKARQWGGSTFSKAFQSWVQVEIKENWHSAICADVEDQAKNIRGMSDEMFRTYPHNNGLSKKPWQGSTKNNIIVERGCIIGVGSMQKPDNLRSYNFKMLVLTEVGLWKKTLGKKPEDLAQTLRAQVKKVPWTVVILESTAKGVGNFFHREWQKAEKGGGYAPVFVPWFMIEIYRKPINDYIKFVEWVFKDDYAILLWELGATLEGINWYFDFMNTENYDEVSMNSEYPSTPQEMFSSTGRRAFSPLYVKKARQNNKEPLYIGDIFGDALFGIESLNNISFQAVKNGQCKVWALPDKTINISNRYVVPVDIGGRTKKADYSVIRVIDRYSLLYGGVPEAILTWKAHLDQDLVIWKATQIAKFYNDALLVPEQNSLNKDQQASEGDHFLTLLDEIIKIYDNIFCRTSPEQIRQGAPKRYGFHTGSNKADLITNINKKLREEGYIEYDKEVCDEYDWYEIKDNGTYGAIDGQHDDEVMCTGIGLKASDLMDMPVEITDDHKYKTSKEIVSEATF